MAAAGPDLNGQPGVPLTFDAFASSDADGEVIAFEWSFNDGTSFGSQSASTAQHTFANEGEYRVRLWVMDDCGELSPADEVLVTIAEHVDPCADTAPPVPNAGPDRQVQPGATVQFDASASYDPDGTISFYGWDFGDGRRTTGTRITHAYQEPGIYIVTLVVFDDCFVWSEAPDEVIITVGNPDPCADNSAPLALPDGPDSGETGDSLSFDGSASYDLEDGGALAGYSWNFGDGATGTGAQVNHAYAQPGNYTVTLAVLDSCEAGDSDTITVEIAAPDPCEGNSPPNAAAAGPAEGEVGQTLNFSANSSADPDNNIAEYAWDFGDGGTATGASVNHAFVEPGDYTVTLTVTDTCGATDSDDFTLEIAAPDPCAENAAPNAGVSGPGSAPILTSVSFSGSTSFDPDGNLDTYEWDFGDGVTATGASVNHAFAEPGAFTVTLTVTDTCGATDEATLAFTASDPGSGEVTAEFTFAPTDPWVNDPVTFTAQAPASNDYLFYWTISDGVSTFARTFAHKFADGGLYEVKLLVYFYDTGEILESTQTVSVYEDPRLIYKGLLQGETDEGWGLYLDGDVAWVAGNASGHGSLVTVDVSNPANPQLLSALAINGYPWQIAASDTLIAVAARDGGVHLFNRADHQNPVRRGTFDTWYADGTCAFGVGFFGDDILYVASESKLKVVDVSNPSAPALLLTLDNFGGGVTSRIIINGDYLYVGQWPGGQQGSILVFDISEPLQPQLVNSVPTRSRPLDMDLRGTLLAVGERTSISPSTNDGTAAFFDVSNPASPVLLGRLGDAGTKFKTVALGAGAAYVTTGTRICRVTLRDPANPTITSTLDLSQFGAAVRVGADGRVYAGLTAHTLVVAELYSD